MNDNLKTIFDFSKENQRFARKHMKSIGLYDENQRLQQESMQIIGFFKGKPKISTIILRTSLFFQRKIKKIRLRPPEDRFDDTFEKTPPRQECEKYAAKGRKCDRGVRFL